MCAAVRLFLAVTNRSGTVTERDDRAYLCVLLVAAVDLGQTLSGSPAGRGRRKCLLHFAGTILEAPLDTIGFIQLVYLPEPKQERDQ